MPFLVVRFFLDGVLLPLITLLLLIPLRNAEVLARILLRYHDHGVDQQLQMPGSLGCHFTPVSTQDGRAPGHHPGQIHHDFSLDASQPFLCDPFPV